MPFWEGWVFYLMNLHEAFYTSVSFCHIYRHKWNFWVGKFFTAKDYPAQGKMLGIPGHQERDASRNTISISHCGEPITLPDNSSQRGGSSS